MKRKCPKCPPLPRSYYHDNSPEYSAAIVIIVLVIILIATIVGFSKCLLG